MFSSLICKRRPAVKIAHDGSLPRDALIVQLRFKLKHITLIVLKMTVIGRIELAVIQLYSYHKNFNNLPS